MIWGTNEFASAHLHRQDEKVLEQTGPLENSQSTLSQNMGIIFLQFIHSKTSFAVLLPELDVDQFYHFSDGFTEKHFSVSVKILHDWISSGIMPFTKHSYTYYWRTMTLQYKL